MKKTLLFLLMMVMISSFSAYSKKGADNSLDYQIEGAGTATQGYYLVEVSLMTKNKNVSDAELCRAAVHGVLFRGFSNPSARQSQKPLAGSAANEAQHIDFYKEFFSEEGTAANYASVVTGTRTITRLDKGYRVKAKINVNKEALVKYLQEMGVIKNLNTAF